MLNNFFREEVISNDLLYRINVLKYEMTDEHIARLILVETGIELFNQSLSELRGACLPMRA